jgi:hypothetical protein
MAVGGEIRVAQIIKAAMRLGLKANELHEARNCFIEAAGGFQGQGFAFQGQDIRQRKNFFFEKKKQKTFASAASARGRRMDLQGAKQIKVFWFFFSKKNPFFNPATNH